MDFSTPLIIRIHSKRAARKSALRIVEAEKVSQTTLKSEIITGTLTIGWLLGYCHQLYGPRCCRSVRLYRLQQELDQ